MRPGTPAPEFQQQTFPRSQLPLASVLGFFHLLLVWLQLSLSTSCLTPSCFCIVLLLLSGLIFYAALLPAFLFLCFTFKHSTRRSDWASSSPSPGKDLSLTKFYSQVAAQKSIQLEYERGTFAQGQSVMTAAQGSSHAFRRDRDMANSQSLEAWPGKYQFANCTKEA